LTEQGNIARTDNPTDIAINGRGYLQVLMPDGSIAYTRAGNLAFNAEGQLVTADGFQVQPGISAPPEAVSVTITRDGIVEATLQGEAQPQQLGQLELANFINPAGLEAIGDNLFLETAASGPPNSAAPGSTGFGTVMQGFIETSNVNAVEEISALIVAQRAYEMNARVITASDEMLQTASQLR
jgi:flagellar basal-body rod protein FlgG